MTQVRIHRKSAVVLSPGQRVVGMRLRQVNQRLDFSGLGRVDVAADQSSD
jgi:hypothetical protein